MKAAFGNHSTSGAEEMQRLASLFQDYHALVYRTAYLILGTREEAEDALQDVFLKIQRSLRKYDPARGAFSTWIYRITTNHCIQRKTRHLWRFLPLVSARMVKAPAPGDEFLEDHELAEALAGLSPQQRALVALRYAWQLSYEEIAQILEVPVSTVKSRHARVIRLLQAYYALTDLPAGEKEETP